MRNPAATVGKTACTLLRGTHSNRAKAMQCSESVQFVHGNARAREAREVYIRHCTLLRPPQRPRRLQSRPDAYRQPPDPHSGNRTRSDGRARRFSRRLSWRRSPPLVQETLLPILEVGWSYGSVLHIRTHPHTPTRARYITGEPGFLGGRASCPPKVFPWYSRRGRDALAPRFAVRTPPYSPTHARARRVWDVQAPSGGGGRLKVGSSGTGVARAAIPLQRQGRIGAQMQKSALSGWRPTRRPSPWLPARCRLRLSRHRTPPPPAMIFAAAHRLPR